MIKNKKAVVSLYFAFLISAIIIILFAAIFAPMGVLFNTEMYKAGENILKQANNSIAGINDTAVRLSVQEAVDSGLLATEDNIKTNAALFQYSWLLVIGLTALIMFLITRRIVEYSGGGFI